MANIKVIGKRPSPWKRVEGPYLRPYPDQILGEVDGRRFIVYRGADGAVNSVYIADSKRDMALENEVGDFVMKTLKGEVV